MDRYSFLYAYVLAGACYLAAAVFHLEWLEWISKPLIMLALGLYYLKSQKELAQRGSRPLLGAIVFSLAGDVLLLGQRQGEVFFLAGLVSFLLAHGCYFFALRQHRGALQEGFYGTQKFRFAFPIVLAGTGLYTILYPHLGSLKGAVLCYTVVIMAMAIQALFRFGHTHAKSFWMVLAGACLFMASDGILAVNKFMAPLAYGDVLVMASYLGAQYLLVEGLMQHQKKT